MNLRSICCDASVDVTDAEKLKGVCSKCDKPTTYTEVNAPSDMSWWDAFVKSIIGEEEKEDK